jgi:hypothetical protein
VTGTLLLRGGSVLLLLHFSNLDRLSICQGEQTLIERVEEFVRILSSWAPVEIRLSRSGPSHDIGERLS